MDNKYFKKKEGRETNNTIFNGLNGYTDLSYCGEESFPTWTFRQPKITLVYKYN